ncbi:hypothetical protein [Neobacillus citreus]|uniref:Uncharacterized protein n=1 Tax=Neobacillus citreus TaxID=2833578 RepID=A0A942SV12_9BACI|nr:hypothetical protein [Neobacillus citreus]MCH6266231.1 hypothetical protein [Neobacillus citreus]
MELIQYLLIDSQIFKQVVADMIGNLRKTNVVSSLEIKELKVKLAVLEGLLNVNEENIQFTLAFPPLCICNVSYFTKKQPYLRQGCFHLLLFSNAFL